MISYYKRTIQDKSIREIHQLEIGCWANVVDPSPEEIDYLVRKFGLDKRNLESGLDQNELPRLDFVKEDIYVFAKAVIRKSNINNMGIETYLIIISRSLILTLSRREPGFVEKILKGRVKMITTQKLKSLIELFSLIDESFEIMTVNIVKNIQSKGRLGESFEKKELEVLLGQENILNNLVSFYQKMNMLYGRVARKLNFFARDKEIVEDLIIESAQRLALCESSLKTISNIRSYYVILLSNKLNRTINVLTVLTIIISLPAAISGIYGMNIALPAQRNPYIFYYISFFIVIMWLIFIFYLKKKKVI